MFTAIHQCYIKEGQEQESVHHWEIIMNYFISEKGAIGAALHKAQDGSWVSYSRWPTQEVRDAAWPKDRKISSDFPEEVRAAISSLQNAVDPARESREILMGVMLGEIFKKGGLLSHS